MCELRKASLEQLNVTFGFEGILQELSVDMSRCVIHRDKSGACGESRQAESGIKNSGRDAGK